MLDVINAVLGIITSVNAAGGSMAVVASVINALETILPIAAQEGASAVLAIKSAITALEASGNLTPDQMTALAALDAQCDAAFDAAAKSAGV